MLIGLNQRYCALDLIRIVNQLKGNPQRKVKWVLPQCIHAAAEGQHQLFIALLLWGKFVCRGKSVNAHGILFPRKR